VFILLDLLGSPSPLVRSFYDQTGWLFDEFVSAEHRLASQGLLWDDVNGDDWNTAPGKSFFVQRGTPSWGHIEGTHRTASLSILSQAQDCM
jgi:hypothetical protein